MITKMEMIDELVRNSKINGSITEAVLLLMKRHKEVIYEYLMLVRYGDMTHAEVISKLTHIEAENI